MSQVESSEAAPSSTSTTSGTESASATEHWMLVQPTRDGVDQEPYLMQVEECETCWALVEVHHLGDHQAWHRRRG